MKSPTTAKTLLQKQKAFFLATGLILVMGFGYAFSLKLDFVKAQAEERYSDLQNFTKVLNLIQQYYVESVDSRKLIYGAIKGMLRELDPHSSFMPPELFKDFESETAGEFGGLGIEISIQGGILTIISPIEDTPAWEAGIKPGDKIIAVDGRSTKGASLVEASAMMKGKKGAKTVLTVVRESENEPKDIAIVRGNVRLKSVKTTDLDEGYLLVRVTSFIEQTSMDLEKALEAYYNKSGNLKGLILDLRRNPGGLLDQAVKVSDLFMKEGVIVSTVGRDKKGAEAIRATGKAKYTEIPIIVLMNEYSASASEIVAGALQDSQRALVMGQKSFGKGSVQHVIKLGDGSGLKLTVARYFTPSGRSIQAEGIVPDVEIEDVDVEGFKKAVVKKSGPREKDMVGHLQSDSEKKRAEKSGVSGSTVAWWKEDYKKGEPQTAKDKLLSSDYQLYQAYNYIRATKLMKRVK